MTPSIELSSATQVNFRLECDKFIRWFSRRTNYGIFLNERANGVRLIAQSRMNYFGRSHIVKTFPLILNDISSDSSEGCNLESNLLCKAQNGFNYPHKLQFEADEIRHRTCFGGRESPTWTTN